MTFDLVGPVVNKWIASGSLKATIIKYWPTEIKTINGVDYKIMADLRYYTGGAVVTTVANEQIYKKLGTSAKSLREEDYAGIDYSYFKMRSFDDDEGLLGEKTIAYEYTHDNILASLPNNENSHSLTIGIVNPVSETTVDTETVPLTSDEQEARFRLGMQNGPYGEFVYDTNETPFVAFMLADYDNQIFDCTIKYTNNIYSGEDRTGADSITSAFIVTFNKKPTVIVTQDYIVRLNTMNDKYVARVNGINTLITHSCRDNYRYVYSQSFATIVDYPLFVNEIITTDDGGGVESSAITGYVLADELAAMKPLMFIKIFAKLIDSGYKKKKVKAWKRIVSVVLLVATVALAIATAGAGSAGSAWMLAGAGIIVTGVQVGLASYWADHGDVNAASMVGEHVAVSQKIGMVVGIVVFMKSALTMLASTATTTGTAATAASTTTVGATAGTATASTISVLAKTLNIINQAFSFYSQYETRKDAKELEGMQQELAEQEEMMRNMPTAKQYELVTWDFQSYNFIEINEEMQQVPYTMTQGQISSATRKYF